MKQAAFSAKPQAFRNIGIALAFVLVLCVTQVQAHVIRDDDICITAQAPVYAWLETEGEPKAVAITIHGLTMHGGVYDTLARRLAENGFVIFAPDLRGYGRWQHYMGKVDYQQSFDDLVALIEAARAKYPGLPLYCIGESLGADFALKAAARGRIW